MSRRARIALALIAAALLSAATAGSALGAFPYNRSAGSTSDYKDFFLDDESPTDMTGKLEWMYAATPEAGYGGDTFGTDLGGVRGAHVGDATDAPPTAWETTLGRPDVSISVLDSGIKWNDDGAMNNLRFKTWINFGEVPTPNVGRNDGGSTAESLLGTDCAGFTATDDANGDSVLNIRDFACDTRVEIGAPRNVNPDLFEPQDILIAFSGGDFGGDDDGNGFIDDMVGWDFLDDDNDPYDDVQYGHGTGEAQDSTAEANNGGELGTCPNCMSMHMRVGDSFVADVNRFAQATIYGVDNGALVIQEALGTLNNTRLARQAVDYAYNHGVTVIASAADEAAQHNNWPSSLPHVILVNSVTQYDEVFSPSPESYLQFTGCTNFNSKVTLSIPSVSCSSDATGRASGMAGLIYSAALNASERSKLADHPTCTRAVDGPDAGTALDPCLVSANEVRQLMATGIIDGTPQADDVDFLPVETFCGAPPAPGCTDPYKPDVIAELETTRTVVSPLAESRAYPARGGHDQFYGYGRVNMENAVSAVVRPPLGDANVDALLPPEVEITSPEWFDQIDPDNATFDVEGQVRARSNTTGCTYRVLLAPGHYPNNSEVPTGDFQEVDNGPCTSPVDGVLASVDIDDLEARFPGSVMFNSQQPTPTPLVENGRPFNAPNGFTIKVTATATQTALPTPASVTGQDHRTAWLHRDQDMLDGFPRKLMGNSQTGDGASSPALADLDGDNDNELIVAGSDGFVHAFRRDGTELSGWPVRTDQPALHTGGDAFDDEVDTDVGGAVLASVAVGDVDRDGIPEVYAADFEGKVYGWNPSGNRVFQEESNLAYGGKPLTPFQNSRTGKFNRTQHGFIGSPVLADIDGNDGGRLEIVAASMDRHLYAWNANGSDVPGYPLLVVDPTKVASINPTTHQVTFNGDSGSEQQGAIVDTPAIGDLDADADDIGADELPEIVVGTNEEYAAAQDGGVNADTVNSGAFTVLEEAGVLSPGNTRLYAINATGDPNADPSPAGAYRAGWPAKVGLALTELLPIVGEGVTGSPVIGPVTCAHGGAGPKVGTIPGAGFGYIFAPDGVSCYDRENGKDRALSANFTASAGKYDTPVLAAVGHPAFGRLLPGASPTFIAPAAGAIRAVDLGANEYQGGQDFVMAWNSETSAPQAGFPVAVNDLQFLTGPSVANIDATPTEEIVAGTASADLVALTAAGAPVPGWPKLTGDWTVANPTIGSFGTIDAGPGATTEGKAVIGLTRSGYILAYDTEAGACTAGSWPRFHHDNANSGNFERDAVLPGKPINPALSGGSPATNMSFNPPGDDLLCGTADHYEIATDDSPIDESNFDSATPLQGAPTPAAPGPAQTFAIPESAQRYLAVRAVDEQGNVGRAAGFDRGVAPPGDADNDGDPDGMDNCQNDFNPDQSNQDGDSLGDACDPDIDGDGVDNGPDNCDIDANPDQADNDGDGIGNACDPTQGQLPGTNPPPAGTCATEKRGTGGGDQLTGTEGGDRLVGLKGNDRILGLGGDDCLLGNKGADRVDGGAGADQISGGNKRDRVVGGPGSDTIRAGNAADIIKARDGEADIVNCGGGVDRVESDPQDRLTNCEPSSKRSKKRRR